ncbi:DUF2274 domain-containing protein [Sphingobium boeckii]|uniref:DUF2274 domain-containing protein n=1 Tax=Sphingobium boeckii TaxID=1082345 RepID=A0A7W9AGA7_9SPHN|nr:DUF2274 domain-containing protein [Sphingobium boeckii]MBB5684987.1 hypothetical protein [Sphingobium boeckii]
MPDIKLARLPDRTPIKLAISIPPELHNALLDYAAIYAEAYGAAVSIGELIPAMLAGFLEGDREFGKLRRSRNIDNSAV